MIPAISSLQRSAEAFPSFHQELLNANIEAVKLAGQIIAEGYDKHLEAQEKGDGDLIFKEIDIRCDELIGAYLKRLYPESSMLSEELNSQQKIADVGITFICDPMDGTVGLAMRAGKDIPSVMIATYLNGSPICSVVYFPLVDELFYAVKGHGAFHNGVRINIPENDLDLRKSQALLNAYQNCAYESDFFKNLYIKLRSGKGAQLTQIIAPHSGAALKMLLPGSKISLVVHDNIHSKVKQEIWDIAPPKLIIEEAGRLFLNDNFAPYQLDQISPILIIRDERILQQLMELISPSPKA